MNIYWLISLFLVILSLAAFANLGIRRILLVFWMRKQRCGLPHMYRINIDKALTHYKVWAGQNNVDVDYDCIKKYKKAVAFSKYGLIALLFAILLIFVGNV